MAIAYRDDLAPVERPRAVAPAKVAGQGFDRAAYQKAYMKTYMKAYMRDYRARKRAPAIQPETV